MSAVSLQERRRLRDVLASRGALRGKKDTVKIQAKATKRSRRKFGLSRVRKKIMRSCAIILVFENREIVEFISQLLGLDAVERRFGSASASVFGFMLWTSALNAVSLLLVIGLVLVPQLAEDAHEGDAGGNTFNQADDGQCDGLEEGFWAPENQTVACCSQL